MKGLSNFGDTQSLEEHNVLSHVFVKSRNSLCHSIDFKKLLGWGEQSVTQHVIVLLRIME